MIEGQPAGHALIPKSRLTLYVRGAHHVTARSGGTFSLFLTWQTVYLCSVCLFVTGQPGHCVPFPFVCAFVYLRAILFEPGVFEGPEVRYGRREEMGQVIQES